MAGSWPPPPSSGSSPRTWWWTSPTAGGTSGRTTARAASSLTTWPSTASTSATYPSPTVPSTWWSWIRPTSLRAAGRSTLPDFIDRYGLRDAPKSLWELEELIAGGIKEAARVLRPGGRLLVKCMDYVNGGQFVSGRHHVVTAALGAGLELVDELVHYSGAGRSRHRIAT